MVAASYDRVLELQRRLVQHVRVCGRTHVILVEHDPPVITLGRRGTREHVLVSDEQLAADGIELRRSTRGGEVTYHGAGQLVAYVIRRLGRRGRSVHGHVHQLEEAVIRLLKQYGIAAHRRSGRRGVWVGEQKIAAVGVAVERWVSYHGLALNVTTNLSRFDLIVPCGQADAQITTLAETLGREVPMSDVKGGLLQCFMDVFNFDGCRQADCLGPARAAQES
ncbi:MAG: lipoyl(octanoyl) transferase LipB [Planctomycetes bacterium]|nr:lipoyl(octanoyl) transferase LipB [Planctomycetota bacterium]